MDYTQGVKDVNALQTLGGFPPFFLLSSPLSGPPFSLPSLFNSARGHQTHFVAFCGKSEAFQGIVSAASCRAAIDLFYDGTNRTVNNTLTKIVRCTRDCVEVIGGPTH